MTQNRAALALVLACMAPAALAAPLAAPGIAGPTSIVREEGEITLNGVPVSVIRYSWRDSKLRTRSVSLVPASGATSGYAVQMTYEIDDGGWRTVYVNAPAAGDAGFGYFVSHELYRTFSDGANVTIAAKHAEDDSPLGRYLPSAGSDYAVSVAQATHEYRLLYPRWGTVDAYPDPTVTIPAALAQHQKFFLPVVIRWHFVAGKDYPLWSVDYDLGAASDRIANDVRGPYGVMVFNESGPAVTALKWGDKYRFAADATPLDFGATAAPPGGLGWTWNTANTGRRYNALGAGTFELGLVDTVPYAASKYADGYANTRGKTSATATSCGYGMQSMPCDWEWAYQSFQYDYGPPTRPKLAWGSSPYLGSSITTAWINSTENEPLSPKGRIAYGVHIVMGASGNGTPLTLARAAVPLERPALLEASASPAGAGSVAYTVLGDAGGPYAAGLATLAPWASVKLTATPAAGYVFSEWEGNCASNPFNAGCVDACKGAGATCIVSMSGSKRATARFLPSGATLHSGTARLDFGALSVKVPASRAFTLRDIGFGAAHTSFQFQFSDSRYSQSSNCTSLSMGSACTVVVTFAGAESIPLGSVVATPATMSISSNASTPITLDLARKAVWRSDILWRNNTTGMVYRHRMNGFGIASQGFAYQEADTAWKIAGQDDFDGDGVLDLLYRHDTDGRVYVLRFLANGSPAGGGLVATEPNAAWRIVGTPDLDGDGRADLLWWNNATGQVYAMWMAGPAILAEGFLYSEPNTSWRIVATGDFAGSGARNQLLWRNAATGQVFLMTIGGARGVPVVSGQLIYQEANTAWKILAAADMNGDARADIVWRNDATGQVYVMLMNGAAIAGQAMLYREPNLAWKIVALADYDGDGRGDLLWRNDATGQVFMLRTNGLQPLGGAVIYQEANAAWRVLGPLEYGF